MKKSKGLTRSELLVVLGVACLLWAVFRMPGTLRADDTTATTVPTSTSTTASTVSTSTTTVDVAPTTTSTTPLL